MTFVLADDKISEIQSSQRLEKPRCRSKLSKKRQFTVSKALAMSTLIRAEGTLFLCKNLAESCTAL
jgi:hypothetical protein